MNWDNITAKTDPTTYVCRGCKKEKSLKFGHYGGFCVKCYEAACHECGVESGSYYAMQTVVRYYNLKNNKKTIL